MLLGLHQYPFSRQLLELGNIHFHLQIRKSIFTYLRMSYQILFQTLLGAQSQDWIEQYYSRVMLTNVA